ncbi:hypothetical protein [Streptomyces sp. NPDC002676]
MILTDAVREAVSEGLRLGEILAPYVRLRWRDVEGCELLPVSGKRPRYARDFADGGWVSALRLGGLLYAPDPHGGPLGEDRHGAGTPADPRDPGPAGRTARPVPLHAPLVDPGSPFHAELAERGVEVASEGMVIAW